MATGVVFEFDVSHHAMVVLLVLGAIIVLPAARKDATVEVVLQTCHKCSSKLSLSANEPKSLEERQRAKITTLRQPPASRDS